VKKIDTENHSPDLTQIAVEAIEDAEATRASGTEQARIALEAIKNFLTERTTKTGKKPLEYLRTDENNT
jgi:hypothetical protein